MAQDAASKKDVKTGEEELLDFEFEELEEESSLDTIEELTSEDIIELVDVIEEGEALETGEAVSPKAQIGEEAPVGQIVLEGPAGEAFAEAAPEGARAEDLLEIQPEAVSDSAAAQSIEVDIEAALKRLETPEEDLSRGAAEETPAKELTLDLEDLETLEGEVVAAESLEGEIEAFDLEEELALEKEETPPAETVEDMEVLRDEALEPLISEEERQEAALQGSPEEQVARMPEGMDLEVRAGEGAPEAEAGEGIEPVAEALIPEMEEMPARESEEISEAQRPQAEPEKMLGAPQEVSDTAAEATPEPIKELEQEPAAMPPMISEEKMEEIITRVVRETVERVARETMAGVAERVITEAIEALKKSLESTPD